MAREYCRVARDHPSFDLVGIVARSREKAATLSEEFGVNFSSENLSDLSNNVSPDLLVCAVSEYSTETVVLDALNFPWVLLVEKPFGLNLLQAESLAAHAALAAHPVYVAFNRRFFQSSTRLFRELQQTIGPRFYLLRDQHEPSHALRAGFDPRVVDNWMFANAIHTVDLLRSFVGSPGEVSRVWRTSLGGKSFVLHADIEFESGDRAVYTSAWDAPGRWSLDVFTESNRWVMSPLEELYLQRGSTRDLEEIVPPVASPPYKSGIWEMLSELATYWDGDIPRLPDYRDSLDSMKMVSEIYETRGV